MYRLNRSAILSLILEIIFMIHLRLENIHFFWNSGIQIRFLFMNNFYTISKSDLKKRIHFKILSPQNFHLKSSFTLKGNVELIGFRDRFSR